MGKLYAAIRRRVDCALDKLVAKSGTLQSLLQPELDTSTLKGGLQMARAPNGDR